MSAGDWIKMRSNLWDDPRIAKVCDLTKATEATVIGGLYWLWATADQHTEDGVLVGMSFATINRKTSIKGMAEALADIGWIAERENGVQIVRFEEHNGSSAKRRCTESKRKMSARNADNQQTDAGQIADKQPQSCAPREEKSKPTTSSLRSEVVPLADKSKKTKAKITFAEWRKRIKESGEKAISDYTPVWDYAKRVGIPAEWVEIAWLRFSERYGKDSNHTSKTYIDWRKVFLNAVESNWFGIWFAKDGVFSLTTVGQQAEISTRQAA